MPEPKYTVGQKIGSLTILSIKKKDLSKTCRCLVYECRCDCGKIVDRDSGYFYKSKVNNCGCFKPSKLTDREDVIFRRLLKEKKYNCKCQHRNQIHFDLSFDEFKGIITKPCHYCGISHSMQRWDEMKDKLSTDTVVCFNGIDRLDSSIGYIMTNCVPCCTHCNLAKRMLSVEEFLAWAKRLYEFSFLKMPPTKAEQLPYKSKWH